MWRTQPATFIGGALSQQDYRLNLLIKIASRDEDAFTAFYSNNSHLVHRFALRFLGLAEDAEEVTLDVYLQVWQTAQTYSPAKGSVLSWLFVITRSRCLDRLRSRSAERLLGLASHTFQKAGTSEYPYIDIERRNRIDMALRSLSPEQQQLLTLTFYSGMTNSELARHLKVPLGTVKSKLRGAIILLRSSI